MVSVLPVSSTATEENTKKECSEMSCAGSDQQACIQAWTLATGGGVFTRRRMELFAIPCQKVRILRRSILSTVATAGQRRSDWTGAPLEVSARIGTWCVAGRAPWPQQLWLVQNPDSAKRFPQLRGNFHEKGRHLSNWAIDKGGTASQAFWHC